MDLVTRPFEDLVRDRIGPDFVERGWLYERIDQALATDASRYVLVTGEPGAGKTSLLAGLATSRPDWLRYFVRRDSQTALAGGDIQSFLLSIGHQLARQRPEIFQQDRLEVVVRQHIDTVEAGGRAVGIRIADLTASPFHRTAALALEQRIIKVVTGSVSGIEIGTANLEPRLLEPDNLAHLALIDPAEVLLAEDPDARIVIMIDALDELAGERASLLHWLMRGPELPRNVRLLLTSRPHAALDPLRSARAGRLREVAIDPGSRQVVDDLVGYAEHTLGTEAITRATQAHGHDPQRLRQDAVRRAAGNFLYLTTYTRALAGAATAADEEVLLARLLASAELPPGLGGLYAFFVATAHTDLDRLGMLEIRHPVDAADTLTPAWEGVGQPILGVLTVARDPLTVEELTALGGIRVWPRAVRNVLARLRWLLDVRGGRVAFYHASVGEFLASEQARNQHPAYAVDTLEWHERIVRHYRGAAVSWAAVDWSTADRYGLVHLAEHVVRCRAAVADEAAELACGGLRRAIRAGLGSDRHFLRLVDLVTERTIDRFPLATGLPTVLYLSVVRRQVLRGGRSLAPAVLGLMARLGRTEEALEYLAALPPSFQQFEAAMEISQHTQPGRPELLELMVETALTVPAEARYVRETEQVLKRAARVLAPYDLGRALRLWERANATGEREEPDPVYRAAAETTSELDTARGLIASLHTDRPGAYLDLAARAEPTEVPDLLRLAEASLADAPLADRLRGRARLAVALAPIEPAAAGRHLAALRSDIDRDAENPYELTTGIAEAAVELAGHDPATTRALLDRLDTAELNGRVDNAFLRAARLWVELGELDRARTLLDRLLTWNNTVWTRVRASTVVTRFDPAEALRMIEGAYATIGPHDRSQGMISQHIRESDLHTVAVELARYDPSRAVAVANEMTTVGWSDPGDDRYTTLAQIAHGRLDAGDANTAQTILAEIQRSAELAPPLVDERHGPYHPATAAQRADQPRSPRDRAEHAVFLFNHTQDWKFLSERRFYRDPADLIRAMAPGSWSIGNPHCLARTIRVFAETIVDHKPLAAAALVNSLTDGGERAIGMAALFRAAANGGSTELASQLWAELNRALTSVQPFEWAVDNQDEYAFAYVRPDHRARFEAAIRLIPHEEADTGLRLLENSGARYLQHALQLSFATCASAIYAANVLRGALTSSGFQNLHEMLLTGTPSTHDGEPLLDIARAMVAFHEFLIAPQRRRAAAMRIKDPVYAAVVDLATPTDGEPVSNAFADRVRDLLPGHRLPAAAGLVAFAAELWPGNHRTRQLATEIITASEGREAQRVVTLAQLATSPFLGDLVDPVDLLSEAQRLPDYPFNRVDQDETVTRLFPILLTLQPPTVALRLLREAVLENWSQAMALLEQAAEPLVTALGVDIAEQLTDAIRRALVCASPDDTAAAEIDGVQVRHRS